MTALCQSWLDLVIFILNFTFFL